MDFRMEIPRNNMKKTLIPLWQKPEKLFFSEAS